MVAAEVSSSKDITIREIHIKKIRSNTITIEFIIPIKEKVKHVMEILLILIITQEDHIHYV